MESRPAHILFDCDGTLVDSHQSVIETTRKVLSEHFERELSLAEVRERFVPHPDLLYKNFGILDKKLQGELTQKWNQEVVRSPARPTLFPGIAELLSELSGIEEVSLYVWTARDRASTLGMLKELDIIHHFLDFSCGDDPYRKPHPQSAKEMLRRGRECAARPRRPDSGLGGEALQETVLFIGDADLDREGAKNLGSHFLQATWCPFSEGAPWVESNHTNRELQVDDPAKCLARIKKFLSEEKSCLIR